MNCGDFETRLNELLDSRRDPAEDAVLKAHAMTCADCHETLDITSRVSTVWGDVPVSLTAKHTVGDALEFQDLPALKGAVSKSGMGATFALTLVVAATILAMLVPVLHGPPAVARLQARGKAREPQRMARVLPPSTGRESREIARASQAANATAGTEVAGGALSPDAPPAADDGAADDGAADEGALPYRVSTTASGGAAMQHHFPVAPPLYALAGLPVETWAPDELVANPLDWSRWTDASQELFEVTGLARYRPVLPSGVLWEGPVSGSLRPVADSFSGTLSLIRSQLPI